MNNGNQSAGVLLPEFIGDGVNCTGLTKREMFAMAAMQGMVNTENFSGVPTDLAANSVTYADALLKELSK